MALNFQHNKPASTKWVLLVALLVVSLGLTALYAREGQGGPLHVVQGAISDVAAPFKFMGVSIGEGTSSVGEGLENLTADDATLSELRDANKTLINQLAKADEYRQEAERLKGLLDMKDASAVDGVGARIIGKSSDAWNQKITIDVGKDDGVESGMTVMGATGVIGQIISTTPRSSEVRLITDPQSGAAAMIQSNRGEGIVRGSLEGLLYLEDVDEANTPKQGDIIVTSGLGGSYVKGLIIGTVVRVDQNQGNATGRIVVAPNDTVSSLEEVLVVKGLSGESGNSAASGQTNSNANATGNGGEGA